MSAELLLLPLGVFAGAVTQRVTGVGFALVSAPLLVLVAGPFQGVILANLLGLTVCVIVFLRTWRDTEWRKGVLLALPALAAIPVGALVAKRVPAPMLMIIIGGLVVLALGAVQFSTSPRVLRGPVGAIAAGAVSGFMNVTAGVGGPAMVLYAVSTDWDHRRFVATFQFYSIFVNLASLLAKGPPQISRPALVASLVALGVGLFGGELVSRRVSAQRARRLVLVLALMGALSTLVKGLVTW